MLLSRRRIIEIYKEYGNSVCLDKVFNHWIQSVNEDIRMTVEIALTREDMDSPSVKKRLRRLINRYERIQGLVRKIDGNIRFKVL